MSEIWKLSATDLAQKIKQREISAREAAQAALSRLDAVNPRLNAVIDYDPARFLARADEIDQAFARSEDPGPLAGVPITVKVNIDQRGFANTNAIKLQRDLIARSNSPVIDNLERAGAMIIGRTNAPAFSFRWFTNNQLYGATKNPRNPSITPGGSSGGAAAATAAGIGAFAHGTDIAGSIRYPAYACGIHGIRPTLGRIAAYNASSPERAIGAQLMATSGPIGRTIADLRLALDVMSRPDPRDPWWTPAPLNGPAVERRAALCLRPGGIVISRDVENALIDAANKLEAAGWRIEQIEDLPAVEEAAEINLELWFAQGFEKTFSVVKEDGDPDAVALLTFISERAKSWSSDTVLQALTSRATITRAWRELLVDYPVLLMPVSAELPFPDGLDTSSFENFERVIRAQLTQLAIPTVGLPAATVSTGLVGDIPVGVQVVAGPYREDLCLLAAETIEAQGVPASPIDPQF